MTSKIEQQVMAGVGAIYIARVLTGATALKFYIFILSVWAIGRLVWVSKVFANFFVVEKGGLHSINIYLLTAVEHTHLAVQLALLVAAVAFISLFLDALRSLTSRRVLAA